MLKKIGLLLCLLFAANASLSATNYYVSPNGSDFNLGFFELAPWASIAKVNSANLGPGDAVYFQRGGVWRDTIIAQSGGITYGAYGSGTMPIISGSNLLTFGWITSGSNVWSYPLGSIAPSQVWFQGVLGTPVSSAAAVLAAGQWFYTQGRLYVYSTVLPGTSSSTIEATQRATDLMVTNVSGVTAENLAFANAGMVGICMCTGATSTGNFNGILITGAYNEGLSAYSGQVNVRQSELVENGIGIYFHAGTSLTVNDSIISDNRSQALIVATSTLPNQVTNTTITGNASSNAAVQTVTNLGSNPLTVGSSILLPNPYTPKLFNYSGISDQGTNVYQSPYFKKRAAQLIVVPFIDDFINLAVAQAVSKLALANGCTMSYALNTKLLGSSDWAKVAQMQASGVEIVAHTRSHSDLANNNVFSIQYTGSATSAIMTIDQTAGRLQTFLNGSSTPDLNLDLSNTYNGVIDVLGLIPAGSHYAVAIQPNQNYFTPINLAGVSKVNIKTAPYLTQARPEYLAWEVEGAQSDIEANLPGTTPKAFATPFTSSNQTVENHIRDAGFFANRNGTLTADLKPNGNWLLSSLDVYNMASEWLPNAFDATKPLSSSGSLVEGLGAAGGVMAVYSHGYDEFSLQNWTDLFTNLKALNATCMTMSQANAYVEKMGQLVPDGTKKTWVQTVPLTPDFNITSSSPIQQGARDVGASIGTPVAPSSGTAQTPQGLQSILQFLTGILGLPSLSFQQLFPH